MSVASFIPELWAAALLTELETRQVYGQALVINRDYEGEVTQAGDTVHINTLGAVTIKDHDRTQPIDPPETLATTAQQLLIDQEKYFNFQVNDVDAAQVRGTLMGDAQRNAAYGLSNVADRFIADLAVADGAVGNTIGDADSPFSITSANDAYDLLVDLSVKLDEADVPDGRFVVIPPWIAGLLQKDERILRAQPQVIPNGFYGQIDRMTVLRSNNSPKEGDYDELTTIVAGHSIGWSFAEQIVKTEAYRPEGGFSDAVKGLHVYGAKIVRPEALALAVVSDDIT